MAVFLGCFFIFFYQKNNHFETASVATYVLQCLMYSTKYLIKNNQYCEIIFFTVYFSELLWWGENSFHSMVG